jgi:very-short-patch-repair endonuclease
MDERFEYIARTLSRTKRKEYENYVINAIWNRLGTAEIKPVSQQYIKYDDGYYLIDLYFPQLNIGIECDEGYHKQNAEHDKHRELTIFDILAQVKNTSEYRALHVDVTRSYAEIEAEINDHVQTICKSIESQKSLGCFSEWRDISPLDYFADKATISVEDDMAFRTIAETCNTLFSTEYENIQMSWFTPSSFRKKYGGEYKVWFPKLAVEGKAVSRGWHNELSQDGKSITEYNESSKGKAYDLKADHYVSRVTFTQVQDPITRKREYRFVGVFKLIGAEDSKTIYARIDDSFPLIRHHDSV